MKNILWVGDKTTDNPDYWVVRWHTDATRLLVLPNHELRFRSRADAVARRAIQCATPKDWKIVHVRVRRSREDDNLASVVRELRRDIEDLGNRVYSLEIRNRPG